MIPIVTPEEMRAIDAAAGVPTEVLVERAGTAVANAAVRMMGGTYGRRVLVIAGQGNNGADGRAAARKLERRGARTAVVDALGLPPRLPRADLVIDAAFGTGFRGQWYSPPTSGTPVLAVDIPSGVDGLTAAAGDGVAFAERTVTFQALKPGLLFPPGSVYTGTIEVADIGLDVSGAKAHLVEAGDVAGWLVPRAVDAHKWDAALWGVVGSPGMLGAAHLVARGALRAGAGYVRLSSPGVGFDAAAPTEAVGHPLPATGWAELVASGLDRFEAVVVGPGLGRSDAQGEEIRSVVAAASLPMVVDGDGLFALGWSGEGAAAVLRRRSAPTVLTPHDGEYAILAGHRPSANRLAAARQLAADLHSIVVLKGPATVIADPDGRTLVANEGDERLATAGTGDVLSGMIGGLLAQGHPPFEAAAAGAWLHGAAAKRGPARGMVAGDLPDLVPGVLDSL